MSEREITRSERLRTIAMGHPNAFFRAELENIAGWIARHEWLLDDPRWRQLVDRIPAHYSLELEQLSHRGEASGAELRAVCQVRMQFSARRPGASQSGLPDSNHDDTIRPTS
jgi:hypothetical protein